jgi:hypothetical protein
MRVVLLPGVMMVVLAAEAGAVITARQRADDRAPGPVPGTEPDAALGSAPGAAPGSE